MRGERGKRLSRLRGERVERSFAHLYETGRMRRTHLRDHENILKRLLIHGGPFNLSLRLRKELGAGTPRGLAEAEKAFNSLWEAVKGPISARRTLWFRLWPRLRNGSFRLGSPLGVLRLASCPRRLKTATSPRAVSPTPAPMMTVKSCCSRSTGMESISRFRFARHSSPASRFGQLLQPADPCTLAGNRFLA